MIFGEPKQGQDRALRFNLWFVETFVVGSVTTLQELLKSLPRQLLTAIGRDGFSPANHSADGSDT